MNIRIVILVLFWQVAWSDQVTCQEGFKNILPFDENSKFVINDLQFKYNHLYLNGIVYIDSIGLWGGFITKCDTIGKIQNSVVFYDTTKTSHLANLIISQISFLDENTVIFPVHLFGKQKAGIGILNFTSKSIKLREYDLEGLSIFPKFSLVMNDNIYLIGYVERTNTFLDNFIIKTSLSGELIWCKYFGNSGTHEYLGDAVINNNHITLSSCIVNEQFLTNPLSGWKKPWIFSIDTSGTIIENWIGSQNDERTLGSGPLFCFDDNKKVLISKEYKEILHHGAEIIAKSPTITVLDSNNNKEWKSYLGTFTNTLDEIFDVDFDILRNELVLGGQKVIFHSENETTVDMWYIKISKSGDIIWDITDSIKFNLNFNYLHSASSVDISESGSIYSSVNVSDYPNLYKGYIVKITPDGCTDTLCIATSDKDPVIEVPEVRIYPNPSAGQLNIEISNLSGSMVFTISDINGKQLENHNFLNGINQIELDLAPGMYISSLSTKRGFLTINKFIIY